MPNMSAKNKIYIVACAWLVLCAAMFLYLFKILDEKNLAAIDAISGQQKELAQLEAEESSFKKAKSDLAKFATETYQPRDLFSRDITLVNQLRILEALAQKLNVKISLSGVSGTVKTVPKTTISGEVLYVPYSMGINGSFANVLSFLESLENLSFVTDIGVLNLSGTGNNISAGFSANFYLKQ